MISLEDVKKIDWQYLVSRRESLIHASSHALSYPTATKDICDIAWRPTLTLRPGPDIFLARAEFKAMQDEFEQGGTRPLRSFYEKLAVHVGALDAQMKTWEAHPPKFENTKAALECFDAYYELLNKAMVFLLPMPMADRTLSQSILNLLPKASDEEKQNWLKILAYPVKDNEHTKEERAFYTLVAHVAAGVKDIDKLIQEHVREFGWIGSRGGWWRLAWTEQDVRDRIEQFLSAGKDPKHELEALEESRLERKQACEQLYKEWKIETESELDQWVALAKEFAFARTWRTDVVYGSEYRSSFLFRYIAERVGWSLQDMSYVTPIEARQSLETGQEPISQEELARRKQFFGLIYMNGELQIFAGEQGKQLMQPFMVKAEQGAEEVKGSVAFPGKVQGKVKIVFTGDDLKLVERGDVLVTVMTFPHFIAAMEKACAFVTDEGGILCHAAIVSREMRKPCITATKQATKIFKDGDMVEVDAEKGTVRKI